MTLVFLCTVVASLFSISSICRDREERLAALSAAQQEAMEELQKKIQLKVRFNHDIFIGHQ